MSTLSNTHTVQSYVVGKTKPLDGQRLSKVTYKVDKVTGIKPESKCVSIPVLAWSDVEPKLDALKGAILGMVMKEQDSIVRGLVEAGKDSIQQDSISMDAVVTYMLESSGRLTGEVIREWFGDSIKDSLLLAFASKLGIAEDQAPTAEQESKLNKILKGYEDSFAKLASGAASFNDIQRENMLKALQFADEDDLLASKFTERLSKKSDDDLLMAL